MANTYTQIYIHIVFAVEGRQGLIKPGHNDELQKYIAGIVSGQKQKLIAINNMPDHLHLLVGLRPDSSLSDLVRDIKANSSKFINEQRWVVGRFFTSRTSKNITPENHSAMNTSLCWKSLAWNTTRDIFSRPARNDFLNMPLLTELEICLGLDSTKISRLRRC